MQNLYAKHSLGQCIRKFSMTIFKFLMANSLREGNTFFEMTNSL